MIGLQSAAVAADREADYPVGTVHLYQFGQPSDDARVNIEGFRHPVLAVTCREPDIRICA